MVAASPLEVVVSLAGGRFLVGRVVVVFGPDCVVGCFVVAVLVSALGTNDPGHRSPGSLARSVFC